MALEVVGGVLEGTLKQAKSVRLDAAPKLVGHGRKRYLAAEERARGVSCEVYPSAMP